MVDATFTSVGVETLDATDDLVVRLCNGARYEQVKERAPHSRWTARDLVSSGVLQQFVRQVDRDPAAQLVLFTASDASEFREIADRARNASNNHLQDDAGRLAAETEWKDRLLSHRSFVDKLLGRLQGNDEFASLNLLRLFDVLTKVTVLDNQGVMDQVHDRLRQRLTSLTEDAQRALETLNAMARDAAIRRTSNIRRHDVVAVLERAGAGPRRGALAIAIDESAYAEKIEREVNATDVAQLPAVPPNIASTSGHAFDAAAFRGRALLRGGHGSGKSRFAANLAINVLRGGRRCLHVRLARWATTLLDALVAELSTASDRPARVIDIESVVAGQALLILDGLDEVPADQRTDAEREILQFAHAHPQLGVIVTARPGSGRLLADEWTVLELGAITHDQADLVLKASVYGLGLPDAIVALTANPLMLGLLVRFLAAGGRPTNEGDLLDGFVKEMLERETKRASLVDFTSARRLAEDVAFEWLSTGRIALSTNQLRELTASVALAFGAPQFWRYRRFKLNTG